MVVALDDYISEGFELGQQLIRMRHAIDLQELAFAKLAADFAATDQWECDGSVSPIDWIRLNCHMTSTAASDRVAVGEHIPKLVESIAAMVHGDVGYAHISVMTRTADAVGDAFDETALLAVARDNSPGKFHFKCLHYRHSVDPKAYADQQEGLTEQRKLSLSTAEDGCLLINGVLDPVGGAAVRSALEPLAQKSGAHDDRLRDQRLADALVELASRSQTTQLQVTSSVETLLGLLGAPAAEMEFSLPVSAATVERMACDCNLTRILMQESIVIDVGRSKRTVEGPVRRALVARDQHCRWPGCDRPAKWSAAHHVVHWMHGGGTDLDNLVMLCHRHHRMVHEGGWQLIKSEGGEILTVPPTNYFPIRPGPEPRGPDLATDSGGGSPRGC